MPDDFAVAFEKEGIAVAIPVSRAIAGAGRIALGLRNHILRIHRHLLGFVVAQEDTVDEESVVSGSVGGWDFGDGVAGAFGGIKTFLLCDDLLLRSSRT